MHMLFKNCKVVILSTNKKTDNALKGYLDGSLLFNYQKEYKTIKAEKGFTGYYHIYFTSDDEIKRGDYCILDNEEVIQVDEIKTGNLGKVIVSISSEKGSVVHSYDLCKKIIATTNNSLRTNSIYNIIRIFLHHYSFDAGIFGNKSKKIKLAQIFEIPKPPQSFIKNYIEEYNKGNVITNVLIEYEITKSEVFYSNDVPCNSIKINPKDNTITIKKVKDSWTREEVENLCRKAVRDNCNLPISQQPYSFSDLKEQEDKWIEENL